ncbi:uncharacterized protein LOC103510405 isoform X1 [Diaphorina citri]|uniref:Uncharacterized protein LOC103510405 isoform X1 n=2 Tax=Diaphorina citri TaxID=121845 RepID=A0A1S3D4G8_DIACI|nr:uncharacterized protein LOC103510405 isoform X1 [Diaphorina citri]
MIVHALVNPDETKVNMGELSAAAVLVILIFLTNSVQTFNTNQNSEKFFKLEPQDLSIMRPVQFQLEPEDSNNDLKASSKRFEKDGSNFYSSKEIYDIKEKSELVNIVDESYDRKKHYSMKKGGGKFREQYQIEDAILDREHLDNLDFMKTLEDSKTNNDSSWKNHTKKFSNNSTDIYKTFKSTTNTNEKLHRNNHPRRKSPEDFGLRHSDSLTPDLIESVNELYDPKEADLNITRLKSKLESFYDEAFMLIEKPKSDDGIFENKSNAEQAILEQFTRNKNGRLIPKEELPDYLKDINFKYIHLSDGNRIRTRISTKLKKKMQQFLQTYTKCRITYKWKDLGIRFWPRYLRQGYCMDGKISCSIPPGMTCKPSHTEYKTILRYHCKGNGTEVKCHWRNIQYPVVTRCHCTCP